MSAGNFHGALQFAGDAIESLNVDAATTIEIAIPTRSDGSRAKLVYIQAMTQVVFEPGFTGETITQGIRMRADSAFVFNVSGFTHILASSEAGDNRRISIAPLEGNKV